MQRKTSFLIKNKFGSLKLTFNLNQGGLFLSLNNFFFLEITSHSIRWPLWAFKGDVCVMLSVCPGVEVSSLPWHLQLQLLPPAWRPLPDRHPLPPGSVPRLLWRPLLPAQVCEDTHFSSAQYFPSISCKCSLSSQPSQQAEERGGCGHVRTALNVPRASRFNKIETSGDF